MLPTNLDDLTPEDIQSLVDSEIAEGLRLEYKQQLPKDESDDKRKFLYRIAAMANAAGGDIIFGIVDKDGPDGQNTGIAARLSGMKIPNAQKAIEPLAHLIRDSIMPRLSGVTMKTVSCPQGDVLLVRVPPSWSKPHMVTIGKVDKFYIRTAIGSSPMSIDEIRRAFSEQGELRETIGRWRAHRVDLIEQKRGPVVLSEQVIMLFHVIPEDAFAPGPFTEAWRIPEREKKAVHVVNGNHYQQYNADGYLCHSSRAVAGPPQESDGYWSYTQLFRSGIAEYAFSNFFYQPSGSNRRMIVGQVVEQQMVYCYKDAIERLRRLGKFNNVYVGFSLLGAEGKGFFVNALTYFGDEYLIRHRVFTSPEVYVDLDEQEEMPYQRTLRPLVDTLWQIGGREETPFRLNGEWNPFQRV